MNITQYALDSLKYAIPPQMLEKASKVKDEYGLTQTIDSYIRDRILCRVIQDTNISGGQEMYLHTDKASTIRMVDTTALYVFPDAAFKGNKLISVTDFASVTGWSTGCCGSDDGDSYTTAQRYDEVGMPWGDAYVHADVEYRRKTAFNAGGTARSKLVGTNGIAIVNVPRPPTGEFTLIVSHDTDLADMPPKTSFYFAELLRAAAKAHFYNDYILTLGQGDASRGYILDEFTQLIQRWEDQEEKYMELRSGWGKVAREADPERMVNHIESMIGFTDLY